MPQVALPPSEAKRTVPLQLPASPVVCKILPFGLVLFTVDEYLKREAFAEFKSEFRPSGHLFQEGKNVAVGEIVAMAGGTPEHSLITMNLGGELYGALKGKNCRVYESNLMIVVPETGLRTYPDLSVICGPPVPPEDAPLAATNPVLLVEVLSPTTEAYDRGQKAEHYRQLGSLREYLLVSTHEARIERHFRAEAGLWATEILLGKDQSLHLESLGVSVALADVYEGMTNPAPQERKP